MGDVVLRDHQQSARIFIDTVDDARPQLAVDAGQFIQLVHQTVHQRAAVMAGRRVDDHSFRFVYDCDIRILIDDVQVQIFSFDIRFDKFTLSGDNLVIGLYFIIRLHRAAVHRHDAVFDAALYITSR